MTTYFPYSALVNLCQTIRQNISSSNPFFGEWNVAEDEAAVSNQVSAVEISEIYY